MMYKRILEDMASVNNYLNGAVKKIGLGAATGLAALCIGAACSNEVTSPVQEATTIEGTVIAEETTAVEQSLTAEETSAKGNNIVENSGTYNNSEYGFSVNHPSDWNVLEGYEDSAVTFRGPEASDNQYPINLTIFAEKLPNHDMDLEDFLQLVELDWESAYLKLCSFANSNVTIDGLPTTNIVSTFYLPDGFPNVLYQQNFAYFINEDTAYMIVLDAPIKNYKTHKDAFDLMINSFKFE